MELRSNIIPPRRYGIDNEPAAYAIRSSVPKPYSKPFNPNLPPAPFPSWDPDGDHGISRLQSDESRQINTMKFANRITQAVETFSDNDRNRSTQDETEQNGESPGTYLSSARDAHNNWLSMNDGARFSNSRDTLSLPDSGGNPNTGSNNAMELLSQARPINENGALVVEFANEFKLLHPTFRSTLIREVIERIGISENDIEQEFATSLPYWLGIDENLAKCMLQDYIVISREPTFEGPDAKDLFKAVSFLRHAILPLQFLYPWIDSEIAMQNAGDFNSANDNVFVNDDTLNIGNTVDGATGNIFDTVNIFGNVTNFDNVKTFDNANSFNNVDLSNNINTLDNVNAFDKAKSFDNGDILQNFNVTNNHNLSDNINIFNRYNISNNVNTFKYGNTCDDSALYNERPFSNDDLFSNSISMGRCKNTTYQGDGHFDPHSLPNINPKDYPILDDKTYRAKHHPQSQQFPVKSNTYNDECINNNGIESSECPFTSSMFAAPASSVVSADVEAPTAVTAPATPANSIELETQTSHYSPNPLQVTSWADNDIPMQGMAVPSCMSKGRYGDLHGYQYNRGFHYNHNYNYNPEPINNTATKTTHATAKEIARLKSKLATTATAIAEPKAIPKGKGKAHVVEPNYTTTVPANAASFYYDGLPPSYTYNSIESNVRISAAIEAAAVAEAREGSPSQTGLPKRKRGRPRKEVSVVINEKGFATVSTVDSGSSRDTAGVNAGARAGSTIASNKSKRAKITGTSEINAFVAADNAAVAAAAAKAAKVAKAATVSNVADPVIAGAAEEVIVRDFAAHD